MTNSTANKRYNQKSKIEEAQLDDALMAELEEKYIYEQFFYVLPIYSKFIMLFTLLGIFMYFMIPATRSATALGFILNISYLVAFSYFGRFKGTDYEKWAKQRYFSIFEVLCPITEILNVSNKSLALEMSQNLQLAYMTLTTYFLSLMLARISCPRDKKSPWFILVMAFPSLIKPRFGIFGRPINEALAFATFMYLGILIGHLIDEMCWNHYVMMHKKEMEIASTSKELSKEIRKRNMAMEVLDSYNDKASFFEVR